MHLSRENKHAGSTVAGATAFEFDPTAAFETDDNAGKGVPAHRKQQEQNCEAPRGKCTVFSNRIEARIHDWRGVQILGVS